MNLHTAYHYLSVLAQFENEESIRAGNHLMWVEYNHYIHHGYSYDWDDTYESDIYEHEQPDDHDYIEQWLSLETPDRNFHYASVLVTPLTTPQYLVRYTENAIRQQLNSFNTAREYFEKTEGLLYYINLEVTTAERSGNINDSILHLELEGIIRSMERIYELSNENDQFNENDSYIRESHRISIDLDTPANQQTTFIIYSNVNEYQQNADFFRSFPVYFLLPGSGPPEQSTDTDFAFRFTNSINHDSINNMFFIAYTQGAVDAQNRIFSDARNAYISDLSIIAVSGILLLGLTVLLMVVAGKKIKVGTGESDQPNKVSFITIDKPYLDISLGFTAGWTVLIGFLSIHFLSLIWQYMNETAFNLIFLAAVLLAVPVILIWLTSFAKRIKAGSFWKHTLIYFFLYKCLFGFIRFLVRSIISLWAGTRLTFKVVCITFTAFCMMFFIGFVGAESRSAFVILITVIFFTTIVVVLMLLYAGRILKLETGARAVSEGAYDTPINVGGGELGSIASSINNISAGINTAVEERMKSERLKTELITNVSHDIRTPLTSIITYTDLLEHEGLDSKKAPEYLEVLKQKSQRLKILTDELFEAAKAATGNIDVHLTDLNIVSLINQVLGESDSAVKSSGLDFRVNLPEKLMARADGRLMQRILENLLSNTFKYSLPSSRVYLDAVSVSSNNDFINTHFIRIELKNVSATELNFDPSELTERFKRGDDSRADGGSGLGLSIVQSFVTAQGGTFEILIDGDLFKAIITLPGPGSSGYYESQNTQL